MRFYLNEASLQGQFEDEETFRRAISALLEARTRSPLLAAMRTTRALADRLVSHERRVSQVVQSWRGSPLAGALMIWVGRNGPFIDEDRLDEPEDLFLCLGVEVTDGGLGEAARRTKAAEAAAAMSFAGGVPDFAQTPLPVIHGFEEEPFAVYDVDNYWEPDAALAVALALEPLPTSWRETVETARIRFPKLLLPDAIFEDPRLARDPFDAIIRDRIFALLGILNAYMEGRDAKGVEGAESKKILRDHFMGKRASFSRESAGNREKFSRDLTFPDPLGDKEIFAEWHGKISHRYYRIHFEWPAPATAEQLKILYIGPKLTKA